MNRLDNDAPTRKPRMSHRSITGKIPLNSGRMAHYESSLERDWLLILDFDKRVERVLEQPFTWSYQDAGKTRRYTPDFLASFVEVPDRWTCVYEVKPIEVLRRDWALLRPGFKAAIHAIKSRGWRFRIITERDLHPAYVENLRFLRRYRDLPVQEMHREALLYTFRALGETTPQAAIAAVWADEEKKYSAIAEMWRMVARGELETSLTRKLTMVSPIWLA